MQLNHPTLYENESNEYGRDDFGGSDAAWIGAIDAHAQLIEMLNGPATARGSGNDAAEIAEEEYLRYLRLGFHLAPTGDQDNHYFTWGSSTDARTGVIAPELTKTAIYEALRSRHVYATEDENLRLIFKVNGHLCGDRISAPPLNSELAIELVLQDDDEPDEWYDIEIYSGVIGEEDAEVIDIYSVEGNTGANEVYTIEDVRYTSGSQYVFFKVTQYTEHGPVDRAWTAPVWLEPPGWQSAGALLENTGGFLASKRSSIYHVSVECRDAKRIKDANLVTGAAAAQGRRRHVPCPR